jgi:hypothetical protein
MRALLLLLVGCAAEPGPVEAWHGAVRLESVLRGEATCEPGAAKTDPIEPFLFTAVLDGDPPLSSLYWCRTAEDCPPAPFATVEVDRLTDGRLEGEQGIAFLGDGTCEASWDGVEATQEGDRVSLVWRWFVGETAAASDEECLDYLDSVSGTACDEVLTFEGTRVP